MEVVGDVIKSVDVVDVNSERTVYILGQLDHSYFSLYKIQFLAGLVWAEIECTVHVTLPKRHRNQVYGTC